MKKFDVLYVYIFCENCSFSLKTKHLNVRNDFYEFIKLVQGSCYVTLRELSFMFTKNFKVPIFFIIWRERNPFDKSETL